MIYKNDYAGATGPTTDPITLTDEGQKPKRFRPLGPQNFKPRVDPLVDVSHGGDALESATNNTPAQPALLPPPPTPLPQSVPQATGFSRGNDLIGSQFTPQDSTTDKYRSLFGDGQVPFRAVDTNVPFGSVNTQQQIRNVDTNVPFGSVNTQVQRGPAVNPTQSDRFRNLTGAQDTALNGITQGPNRTELAKRTLADFNENSALQRQQGIRDIGRSAATLGRIGAGMTTNDLTGLEGTLDRQRRQQENQLAQAVAEGDINDRYRTLDATTGLRNQEDQFGRADRNELRGERDYNTGLDTSNVNRAIQERNAQYGAGVDQYGRNAAERNYASGIDSANIGRNIDERNAQYGAGVDAYGRSASERNAELTNSIGNQGRLFDRLNASLDAGRTDRAEQRGERSYQYGLSQDALNNDVRERQLQDQEMNDQYSHGDLLARLGFGNDPSGAYRDASNSYGNDAGSAFGALGNSLGQQSLEQILAKYFPNGLPTSVGGSGSVPPGTSPSTRPPVTKLPFPTTIPFGG